jgi:hypothetical protein
VGLLLFRRAAILLTTRTNFYALIFFNLDAILPHLKLAAQHQIRLTRCKCNEIFIFLLAAQKGATLKNNREKHRFDNYLSP